MSLGCFLTHTPSRTIGTSEVWAWEGFFCLSSPKDLMRTGGEPKIALQHLLYYIKKSVHQSLTQI